MKLARFAYNGQIHEAEYRDEQLWIGIVAYGSDDVMWLPPTETRGITVYGVALGYADHAVELGLEPRRLTTHSICAVWKNVIITRLSYIKSRHLLSM